jgi:hypothetical protein
MVADTLTKIDTTARLDSIASPDSTAFMLKEWQYSPDSDPLMSLKCWQQDSIQLFHQRNSSFFTRHDGIFRADKMMSESLLLVLLLLETLLVAYLVKNGLKFLNSSIKNALVSDEKTGFSVESVQKGSQFRQFLWILSMVVFALFAPILYNLGSEQGRYELNSWLFLRLFVFVAVYFTVKYTLFRMIGHVLFTSPQTQRWVDGSKTTVSFYALTLTPILICSEIGIPMHATFVTVWIVVFLLISKFWLLAKAVNIFSVRIGDILYLILYLCTLEILPILLFYKGLFLL